MFQILWQWARWKLIEYPSPRDDKILALIVDHLAGRHPFHLIFLNYFFRYVMGG